jgi:preprotein translocase subunit YajC
MFALNQGNLNQMLQSIASGFFESPKQIAIFIIIVIVFISIFITFYFNQKKKTRKASVHHAHMLYETLARKLRLTESEKELLAKLSHYLKDTTDRPKMFEDESIFNKAAQELERGMKGYEKAVAALRLKLGFQSQSLEKVPYSSSILPIGMPVVIVKKGRERINGRIQKPDLQSLNILLDAGSTPPKKGSSVGVYFRNLSGLFGFITTVQRVENGKVRMNHSEKIRHIQRREYYRKKIRIPADVKMASSREQHIATSLVELGGNGGSFLNPEGRYKEGDRIDLSFYPSHHNSVHVTAQVRRISSQGKIAHIQFENISDSDRDHILGLLFSSH